MDRGVLDQQLQKLGEASRWWAMRELRDLPAVLQPDEIIAVITRGRVARFRMLRRSWLILATDRRLICIRSTGRSWRQIEVAGQMITRVSLRVGPFRGRVRVRADGRMYKLLVPQGDAYRLQAALLAIATLDQQVSGGFAPTRVVGRIVDHVLALPAVALDPAAASKGPSAAAAASAAAAVSAANAEKLARIHELEDQVQQLRDQVEFLEQLLKERNTRSIAAPNATQ